MSSGEVRFAWLRASFSLRAPLLRTITTRGRFCIEEQNALVRISADTFSLHNRAAFSKMFLGTPGLGLLQRMSVRLEELVLLPCPTPSSGSALYMLGLHLNQWVPLLK